MDALPKERTLRFAHLFSPPSMLLIFLVLAASITGALATPLNVTITQHVALHKRGAPVVKKNDYTDQQIEQIKEGHLDAIKLASMVVA